AAEVRVMSTTALPSSTVTPYTRPRSTTLIPSSGSITSFIASMTSSELTVASGVFWSVMASSRWGAGSARGWGWEPVRSGSAPGPDRSVASGADEEAVVALGLETLGQLRAALLGDPPVHEDVHVVRRHVLQDSGVVGDQHDADVGGLLGTVDALGDHAQGVHVETGVGLVEDRDAGLEQLHLADLVALLLAAGEALGDGALGEDVIHLEIVHGALDVLDRGAQRGGLAVDRGLGGAQEVGHGHAGDLDRVLHGQEQAGAGALVDAHLEHVLAVEGDLAGGDLVLGVTGDRVGEGGLARAVGAHDRVGLARLDGEVDPLEDLLGALRGLDGGVEVLDLQDRNEWFSLTGGAGGSRDGAPGRRPDDQVAGAAVGSTRISPLLSSMRTGKTRTGRTAGSCRGRPVTRSNWLPCFQHSRVHPSTSPSLSAISSCEQ